MRNYASVQEALHLDLADDGRREFITSDMSVKDVRKFMLRKSFYKKLSPHREPTPEQVSTATEKFRRVNAGLVEDFVWESENEAESCFWDYFCDHLNQALLTSAVEGGFDYSDLREHMTAGPGAAQKANADSWHTKVLCGTLSYTNPDLIGLYRTALSETGSWAEAEMLRSAKFGFTQVEGGKLFFVLKNIDEARTCCTEPLLNSLVQHGVRGWLEKRAKAYFGIDISEQPAVNRRLAQAGSSGSDSCTVDLTSASDSNSLSLFRKVVRRCFLKRCIESSRCEVAVLPNGDIERLRMVSTMGNGFTFPLMTIILASAVRACLDLMDPHAEWSVFGDDIVVPKRVYEFYLKMIQKLGYMPNENKSFGTGHFRESCGHDYYRGEFVRGVYITSLETPSDVYSSFNRLARWSSGSGIPLVRTLSLLKGWARDLRVPPSEDDLSGFKVPSHIAPIGLDARHWFKYRCLVRKPKRLEVEEKPSEDWEGLTLDYLPAVLHGVYKHAWEYDPLTGQSTAVELGSFLREPPSVPPRMKIATRSLPYWDYDKPDSEPGEKWLPSQPTKKLTKYDLDGWRLLGREVHERWEVLVVAAVRVSGGGRDH